MLTLMSSLRWTAWLAASTAVAATLLGAGACSSAESLPAGAGGGTTTDTAPSGGSAGSGGTLPDTDGGVGGGDGGDAGAGGLPDAYPTAATIGLRRGPYLQSVTDSSIIVMWEAEQACSGYVEIWSTAGYTVQGPDAFAARHEMLLPSLPAQAESVDYRFRCLTPALADPAGAPEGAVVGEAVGAAYRFAVYGDSQTNPAIHAQVVASLLTSAPDLLMHVGDEVDHGAIYEEWDAQLFAPLAPLAVSAPFFVAVGNHEENAANFYELLAQPAPENYFAFAYGNSFNIVLDSNELSALTSPNQIVWLAETLSSPAAQSAEWLFVFAHQPPYSEMWGSPGYDGTPYMRDAVLPLLNAAAVDVYFAGHAHGYQRGSSGGTVLIVTGGGGGALDQVQQELSQIDVALPAHHFVQVDVAGPHLELRAVDTAGATLDTLLLDHGTTVQANASRPASPLVTVVATEPSWPRRPMMSPVTVP
jgi:hypothetical protein